jgi:hypothetical protein
MRSRFQTGKRQNEGKRKALSDIWRALGRRTSSTARRAPSARHRCILDVQPLCAIIAETMKIMPRRIWQTTAPPDSNRRRLKYQTVNDCKMQHDAIPVTGVVFDGCGHVARDTICVPKPSEYEFERNLFSSSRTRGYTYEQEFNNSAGPVMYHIESI